MTQKRRAAQKRPDKRKAPLKRLADMKPDERREFVRQFNALRADDVRRMGNAVPEPHLPVEKVCAMMDGDSCPHGVAMTSDCPECWRAITKEPEEDAGAFVRWAVESGRCEACGHGDYHEERCPNNKPTSTDCGFRRESVSTSPIAEHRIDKAVKWPWYRRLWHKPLGPIQVLNVGFGVGLVIGLPLGVLAILFAAKFFS